MNLVKEGWAFIKDKIAGVILDFFSNIFLKVMNDCIDLCKDIVDNISKNIDNIDFWLNVFSGIAVSLTIVVVLSRIIITLLKEGDDSTEVTVSNIIFDTIKSASGIPLMVILQEVLQRWIIFPLAKMIFSVNSDFTTKKIEAISKTGIGGKAMSVPLSVICFAFFACVLCVFVVKCCIFYAETMWFTISTPLVAVSMASETFDYFSTWWRKLLYLNLSLIAQMLSMTLMVTCILNVDKGFIYLMASIGFGYLVIHPPLILEELWRSTGTTKGAIKGVKNIASNMVGRK